MELNEPFEGHEHATTSLKVVLLVFALVLVGALAYLVQATYSQTEETAEVAPSVKEKTEEATATSDETADWTKYSFGTDSMNGFTVKHPTDWEAAKIDSGSAGITQFGLRPKTLKNDYLLIVKLYDGELANVESIIKSDLASTSTFIGKTEATIGSEKAVKLSFQNTTNANVKPSVYLIDKFDVVYALYGGEGVADTVANDTLIGKIINTFQAVKTVSAE